jgi:uncharacterized protein YndB with AHSA1/START domain
MTEPQVPHRIELTVDVAAPADHVWQAIATSDGVSSWFIPHEFEGRVGGRFVVHMAETDSTGQVTGWDPPRRFAYEEDWATLLGHPDADVTPLATEFLVEARAGGTCVVRVVTSAFGTGADWEGEFFDALATGWEPFLDLLRLYVTRFPGQRAATRTAEVGVAAPADEVRAAMQRALGVARNGEAVEAWGLSGTTLRVTAPFTLIDVTDPSPGYVAVGAVPNMPDDGGADVLFNAYLFGPDAEKSLDAALPRWREWLASLPVPQGARA